MDKKLSFVGYGLMIFAYAFLLVYYLGYLWGLVSALLVTVFMLAIYNFFRKTNREENKEESKKYPEETNIKMSVGDGAKGRKVSISRIKQIVRINRRKN